MKDIINIRLKAVYEFINLHYKALLIFSVPVTLVYHVLQSVLIGQNLPLQLNSSTIAAIFFGFIYIGVLMTVMIYLIDGLTNKKRINSLQLQSFIKRNFLAITASIFIIILLTNIAFLMLIVPGIYVFTRLAAVPFLISLDNVKLLHSIDLSFEYSKKYTWPMFFCFLIITFIQFNIQVILALLQIDLAGFMGTVINGLIYVVEIILVYHFYLDIKRDMLSSYNKQLQT